MGKQVNSFESKQILLQTPIEKSDKNSTDYDYQSLESQKSARYGQDTRHRNLLVWWMIIVITIWLVAVLLFVAFNNPWCLNVSETVLVTLLATTTANVLGLPSIILRDLFGKGNRWRNNNKSR